MNNPFAPPEPPPGNRLGGQRSPYLRQHAHNPVAWQPWDEQALEQARREDKPLLVSIGYAACHWCHVMEAESFSDDATARVLNEHYVCIKVDREERPDLDAHFMDLLNRLTGGGGWPLNVLLTPELRYIHGGTYFPTQPRHGLPSFRQVLEGIARAWRNQRGAVREESARVMEALQFHREEERRFAPRRSEAGDEAAEAARYWLSRMDWREGGFGHQPKFPQPVIVSFLLRRAAAGDDEARRAALLILERMAAGGVRDQLGGMFHRYSTDAQWHIPHFEIMLYDNALLLRLYVEGFRLTGDRRWGWAAREIADDALNRLRLPEGSFASSLDADTADGEGYYYTWTPAEVEATLGPEESAAFLETFVHPFEGWLEDRAVLFAQEGPAGLAERWERFAEARRKLRAEREKRPPPALDDKVVASWNGLMIGALAQAGAALDEPRYLEAARRGLAALWAGAMVDGALRHVHRGADVGAERFEEDAAFVLGGALDLFEAGGDAAHLATAQTLADDLLRDFQPAPDAPLQRTPTRAAADIPPQTPLEDGVLPSGNGAAAVGLRRLARLTGLARYEEAAAGILAGARRHPAFAPPSAVELLGAEDFASERGGSLVIVAPLGDAAGEAMAALFWRRFRPGWTLARVEPGSPDLAAWPALREKADAMSGTMGTAAEAYPCPGTRCLAPVRSAAALQQVFEELE
ncbi:MAG: thioredoxin domain-containing protein [Magnetococcales bacterium]|nr:thioredoxin domain-containing protein [Magnetococcales bacterium]